MVLRAQIDHLHFDCSASDAAEAVAVAAVMKMMNFTLRLTLLTLRYYYWEFYWLPCRLPLLFGSLRRSGSFFALAHAPML